MNPSSLTRPRLVPPALAARVPSIRQAGIVALVIGALTAAAVVVQAVAIATAMDHSLLHHAPLRSIRPELIALALAVVARGILTLLGEVSAHRTAESVARTLRGQLLRQALDLGPSWLGGERPGELSLTATRGLSSLHTYFARYVPQAAMAAIVPLLLLIWIGTQSWPALVVVVALVIAVPVTMIHFGREATRRTERQWRRLGSLAGRYLQLIEGLPTLRAFGRDGHGRREVAESAEGVRAATMRTLRVAFLSALAMDMIAAFGVGFVAMVLGLKLLWGELSLETAMAVLLVAPEIFVPLRRAGAEFHASTEGQAAAARVLDVLALPVPHRATMTAATRPAPSSRQVTLRIAHLGIEYDRARHPGRDRLLPVGPAGRPHRPGRSVRGGKVVRPCRATWIRPALRRHHVGGRPTLGRPRHRRLAGVLLVGAAATSPLRGVRGREPPAGRRPGQ